MEVLNMAVNTARTSAFSLPHRPKSEAVHLSSHTKKAADGVGANDDAVPASLWNAVELAAAYLNFM